jgi:ribonuclease J
MTPKKNRLRVVPLGGLDEIGKNMTALEYGNDMLLVDAGLMFPDDDHPGVDLILPDYSYVLRRADKLRGIVITHGHEDHIGALPYLLKDLGRPVPILGTKLTLGLLGDKLAERQVKKPKLREIRAGGHVSLGIFGIDAMRVNHSIPDALSLMIRTPVGNILHTGDFKFDQTPIDGLLPDYSGLAKAARQGVVLMMSDSTNAERPGVVISEAEVGVTLRDIIGKAEQRVIVASFASHIHRVQQVCDAAVEAGRKVAVTGRSMVNNVRISRELGYLSIDDKDLIDAYDAAGIPPEKTVVLSTGSQGEPLSALARMANGDHKTVQITEGDTVVISASPVPGNEKAVSRIINRLAKAGATVIDKHSRLVHVSGHGASEDLKLMLNLVQPANLMPVHGETRHLHAHARLAESVGLEPENVFICENGDVLEVDDSGRVQRGAPVESGVVYVDGLSVGDIGHVVLRDREKLSQDGIATVIVPVDGHSGLPAGVPQVVMRGVVDSAEEEAVLEEARARVQKTLDKTGSEGVTDQAVIKKAVRDSLSQFMWDRARSKPMVIPVVLEV